MHSLSIYIHVPFCRSRCIYCDFYVVLEKHGGKEAFVHALLLEIKGRFAQMRKDFPERMQHTEIQTLYVGGGTPSLLQASDYTQVFKALQQELPLASDMEATLEANPGEARDPHGKSDSAMASDAQAYLEAGFNRISVGVQSFNNAELKKLSRAHSAEEAEDFIRSLQAADWNNISLDLMYGLPLQSRESWRETLHRACALNVQHMSMYGLKVEEGTPLDRLHRIPGDPGRYAVPDDDVAVEMYFEGIQILETSGFKRYEISNFATQGRESKHNMNYWQQGEWLALGPSAHGHINHTLIQNVRNLNSYLQNPLQEECRTSFPVAEQLENKLIFGLRTSQGVHIPSLEKQFNIQFKQKYARVLQQYEGDYLNWHGKNQEWLYIPEKAVPLSHSVLTEFMSYDR